MPRDLRKPAAVTSPPATGVSHAPQPSDSDSADSDVGRFDRWSSRYDRSVFQPLFFHRVHREIVRALSSTDGERILDVGCGTGRLATKIGAAGPAIRTYGVDAAPGMIAEATAKRSGTRAGFAVASAEALPFGDHSFDAAVSAISAHHWGDAGSGFREMRRVVRPGGRIVVADVESLGSVVALMKRARMADPGHHPGWTTRALGEYLYAAGFRDVRSRTVRAMGARVILLSAIR